MREDICITRQITQDLLRCVALCGEKPFAHDPILGAGGACMYANAGVRERAFKLRSSGILQLGEHS